MVDDAVAASFAEVLPAVHDIQKEMIEGLLTRVPAEYRDHAVRDLMNAIGNEIFDEVDLARFLNPPT